VLIHAVAGGVGTAAVQIGMLLGVEMYGTSSSEEKLARVKTLGLQHGINYTQRDYEQAIEKWTRGEVWTRYLRCWVENTPPRVPAAFGIWTGHVYGLQPGNPPNWMRECFSKGTSVHGCG